MKIVQTELPGVLAVDVDRYGDSRGSFLETWHKERYASIGLDADFVQDNVSFSHKGVLRGLHYQNPQPQGKLVYVLEGEIFDVAVDIRLGSPTFKRWFGMTLSFENNKQLYIPEGFAHGFAVLSPTARVGYKCTGYYRKDCERTIRWDDPDIGVRWPVADPVLSDKDRAGLFLKDMPREHLFTSNEKRGNS
ncbi:MAG TPA: dTDP-4-dehydrorhamnose 3,5-epimerase [Bacteroidota bacterium]|nr:dTDP-4-dehydrorhamnose 3,5-epimerase [Bacteroidota bacterium]